jgi:hypothetical protein
MAFIKLHLESSGKSVYVNTDNITTILRLDGYTRIGFNFSLREEGVWVKYTLDVEEHPDDIISQI